MLYQPEYLVRNGICTHLQWTSWRHSLLLHRWSGRLFCHAKFRRDEHTLPHPGSICRGTYLSQIVNGHLLMHPDGWSIR